MLSQGMLHGGPTTSPLLFSAFRTGQRGLLCSRHFPARGFATWVWPARSTRGSLQRRASFPEAKDRASQGEGVEASHRLPAQTDLRFRPKQRRIQAPPKQPWVHTPELPAAGDRPIPAAQAARVRFSKMCGPRNSH